MYRTVLSAIGELSPTSVADLARRYPGRIIPAVMTKGQGYAGSNPDDYYARLASQVNSGRFSAMAEVLIFRSFSSTWASFTPRRSAGRLIEAHPTVYFQTSATIPDPALRSGQPWINLFVRGVLMPEWRRLFVQYSDRFVVFALDAIGDNFSRPEGYYIRAIKLWRSALGNLPPQVAEAVTYGNAERLWKPPPKTP